MTTKVVDKVEDTVDMFQNFADLLDLSIADTQELQQSFNVLSALPGSKRQITVKLPNKVTRKLRTFVNLARKFGGLIKVQEFLGEMGASLVSNAAGLESPGFKMHPVHGIDQIRYSQAGGFWAIIEAKGGKIRLGSTIHTGKQMSPKWIRHWVDDTIERNRGHEKVGELREVAKAPYPHMLASVVRVNATGKRWELKVTVNKVKWNTPSLSWRGA